jgi:hypothetical protein
VARRCRKLGRAKTGGYRRSQPEDIKGIEAMIAMAEARRNGALCEIERHRATLAQRLRQTVQQIDAEYQTLDVKSAGPKRLS